MSSSAVQCLKAWEPPPRPTLELCPPLLEAPHADGAVARVDDDVRAEPEATVAEILTGMVPALRRRAQRWCRDAAEAEDLAQETLLRGLAFEGGFRSEQHVRAWLFTVLRNLFITRRRRQRSASSARLALQAAESRGQAPAAPFLTSSVERALGALPEAFAQVIVLVDLHDHTYAEASSALGIPVGTVMSRLFRGRQRLAAALAEAR